MQVLSFWLSTRRIKNDFLEHVDPSKMQIQSRESDALIKRWDHLITIRKIDENHCHYIDEIEIDAGLLTPFVWTWAIWFYRHRQRRWRALVRL